MAQHRTRWNRHLVDPWNLLEFAIVVVCFLPVNTSYAAVLRLAWVVCALRLMVPLPQLIVGALVKSIPSIGHIGILL